jgi:hypothetical protein
MTETPHPGLACWTQSAGHSGPATTAAAPRKPYVAWIRRCIRFHGKRHPAEMAAPEITRFLTSLAVEAKVAVPTQNQALSAHLSLYRDVPELDAPG